MPSLNFDYTQFLKKQNALYLLKYQNDPIEIAYNPGPIAGYSGHVPSYRSGVQEQRIVRSLVRCLTSPTKPTTATGFKSKTNRLPELRRPSTAAPVPQEKKADQKTNTKVASKEIPPKRAQTAPPTTRHEADRSKSPRKSPEDQKPQTPVTPQATPPPSRLTVERPTPARISMMSAGSSDTVRRDLLRSPMIRSPELEDRPQTRRYRSRPNSTASTVSQRPLTQQAVSKHPTGYANTLYGASYWYMWPGEENVTSKADRPESYDRDRRLNRNDNVIYHKHEGILPKYMGYVPGYKFRHGSTFGVLTSHATSYGAVYNNEIKGQ